MVGITSAKLSNNGQSSQATIEGIGFAIPINDVIGIVTDYMQYGYVTGRPSFGMQGDTVPEQWQEGFGWPAGVYITEVDEGSCAEKAGLRKGDVITKLDDTEITSRNELVSAKNRYRAGDTVTVEVYRSGERLTLQLTFDEQENTPDAQEPAPQPTASGNQGGQYPYGDQNPYGGEEYEDFFNSFPWNYFFGR